MTTIQFDAEINAQSATDSDVTSPFVALDESGKVRQFLTDKCWIDANFANEINPRESCRLAVLKEIGEATRRVLESRGVAAPHTRDVATYGDLFNLYMMLGDSGDAYVASWHTFDALAEGYIQSTIAPERLEHSQQSREEPVDDRTNQWGLAHTVYGSEGIGSWVVNPGPEAGVLNPGARELRHLIEEDWLESAPTSYSLVYNLDIMPEYPARPLMAERRPIYGRVISPNPARIYYRLNYVPAPAGIAHRHTYEARIDELRKFAADDEDIGEINEASVSDFWSFMERTGFSRQSRLALLDNGNLRAVWRKKGGHNVGLEFQGNQSALYVIFKRYSDERPTDRLADIGSFNDVVEQLEDLDLLSFVNG